MIHKLKILKKQHVYPILGILFTINCNFTYSIEKISMWQTCCPTPCFTNNLGILTHEPVSRNLTITYNKENLSLKV